MALWAKKGGTKGILGKRGQGALAWRCAESHPPFCSTHPTGQHRKMGSRERVVVRCLLLPSLTGKMKLELMTAKETECRCLRIQMQTPQA